MTPAQRRELTDRRHRHLSIVRQCQLMGVSRSSLYYRPKETSRQDLSLMREMDRQYLETPFEVHSADYRHQTSLYLRKIADDQHKPSIHPYSECRCGLDF